MMTRPELEQLTFEIDRHLRELRGTSPPSRTSRPFNSGSGACSGSTAP